jgi:hypothetical protein
MASSLENEISETGQALHTGEADLASLLDPAFGYGVAQRDLFDGMMIGASSESFLTISIQPNTIATEGG